MMNRLLLILLLFPISSAFAENEKVSEKIDDYIKENLEKIKEPSALNDFKKTIASLEFNTNIEKDFDLLKGLGIYAGYEFAVAPTWLENNYLRIDNYKVVGKIKIGDFIPAPVEPLSPFTFNIEDSRGIVFSRIFPSKTKAILSLPMTPNQAPFTSHKFDKLPVGTVFTFPSEINFISKASLVVPLTNLGINLKAGASYIINSKFQISILKETETKSRIRIAALNARSKNVSAGVEYPISIFEISFVDRFIVRKIGEDIFKTSLGTNNGDLFYCDYILDMSDIEVRENYDRLFSQAYKLKPTGILKSKIPLETLHDLTGLENLALMDKFKEKKRVELYLKARNTYHTISTENGTSFLSANIGSKSNYTTNDLKIIDQLDNEKSYFYTNQNDSHFLKFFFGLSKDYDERNLRFIYRPENKDDLMAKNNPFDIAISYTLFNRQFFANEQKNTERFFLNNVPKQIRDEMHFGLKAQNKMLKKSLINFNLYFDHKISSCHQFKNSDELKKAISKHGHRFFRENKDMDSYFIMLSSYLFHKGEIFRVLRDIIFHNNGTIDEDLAKRFANLQSGVYFQAAGLGLIFDLLNCNNREDLMKLNIKFVAKNVAPVQYNYGKLTIPEIYNQINRIDAFQSQNLFEFSTINFNPQYMDLD